MILVRWKKQLIRLNCTFNPDQWTVTHRLLSKKARHRFLAKKCRKACIKLHLLAHVLKSCQSDFFSGWSWNLGGALFVSLFCRTDKILAKHTALKKTGTVLFSIEVILHNYVQIDLPNFIEKTNLPTAWHAQNLMDFTIWHVLEANPWSLSHSDKNYFEDLIRIDNIEIRGQTLHTLGRPVQQWQWTAKTFLGCCYQKYLHTVASNSISWWSSLVKFYCIV